MVINILIYSTTCDIFTTHLKRNSYLTAVHGDIIHNLHDYRSIESVHYIYNQLQLI